MPKPSPTQTQPTPTQPTQPTQPTPTTLTFAKNAARPLFALLAPATLAACASGVGASFASSPLCDGFGAPACGNIGQAGRQGASTAPDGSRTRTSYDAPRIDASPRIDVDACVDACAPTFPNFEVATTTLAAVGVAATTVAVLVFTDWGDAPTFVPARIDVPVMPTLAMPFDVPVDVPVGVDVTPQRKKAPSPIVPVTPSPLRPLVELASVRVQSVTRARELEEERDECKRDQAQRPLVDNDYRPACGNAMTKGGPHRGRR